MGLGRSFREIARKLTRLDRDFGGAQDILTI